MRYYSPYPTLTNLRGGLGSPALGQVGARISIPTKEALAKARPMPHREAAKELGLRLPAVPAGLTGNARAAWSVMEGMDIINARLEKTFRTMAILLGRGGALCEDLNLYNNTAIDLYRLQQKQLRTMRRMNVQAIPDQAPFPNLFVGRGGLASEKIGVLDCRPEQVVGSSQAFPAISCPQIMPEGGLDGLGVAPIVVIGIAAIVAFGGIFLAEEVAGNWRDVRLDQEMVKRGEVQARWLERRMEMLLDFVERCQATGKNFDECMAAGVENLPKTLDEMDRAKLKKDPARSWIWWVGIGTILVGAGVGIGVYLKRRKE